MTTVIDINRLLESGESQIVEFKTSFGRETIETLIAFANAQGGSVLVGVADDALVKGVTLGKETLNDWLGQIKSASSLDEMQWNSGQGVVETATGPGFRCRSIQATLSLFPCGAWERDATRRIRERGRPTGSPLRGLHLVIHYPPLVAPLLVPMRWMGTRCNRSHPGTRATHRVAPTGFVAGNPLSAVGCSSPRSHAPHGNQM